MSNWLPTGLLDERLDVLEAQRYVTRLQRALGSEWRVSLFPLHGGGRAYLGNMTGNATVEIRRALPPKAGWQSGPYAGVTPRERR